MFQPKFTFARLICVFGQAVRNLAKQAGLIRTVCFIRNYTSNMEELALESYSGLEKPVVFRKFLELQEGYEQLPFYVENIGIKGSMYQLWSTAYLLECIENVNNELVSEVTAQEF